MPLAIQARSAESFLRLFAVWGLGLAGMPADLDLAAEPAVQPSQAATETLRQSH
ncbi:MAG: hypothetical protein Q7J29_00060 [Stagnimonas sp.]|nr:hypothetical protein [Stagnimonas sp.]